MPDLGAPPDLERSPDLQIAHKILFGGWSQLAITNGATVVAGDFNGDTKPDVAVDDHQNAVVSVLLGNGNGTFQPKMDSPGGNQIGYHDNEVWLAAGNFDGNLAADLVTTDAVNLDVLLGKGDGSFQTPALYPLAHNDGFDVATGDLDRDGLDDIVALLGVNTVTVFLNRGDGTFNPGVETVLPSMPSELRVGDVDHDGNPDIVTDDGLGQWVVLLGLGNGSFQPPIVGPFGIDAWAIALGDFNGDKALDLVAVGGGSAFIYVSLGDGKGHFGAATAVAAPTPFLDAVATADFNRDGTIDVAVAEDTSLVIFAGLGNGTFAAPTSFKGPFSSRSMAVADFNGDGRPDIAIETAGAVGVLLNTSP